MPASPDACGRTNQQREREILERRSFANGEPEGEHSNSNVNDGQSMISLSSIDFPTLAHSVQDIINDLDKSSLRSPPVETSYGTFIGQ